MLVFIPVASMCSCHSEWSYRNKPVIVSRLKAGMMMMMMMHTREIPATSVREHSLGSRFLTKGPRPTLNTPITSGLVPTGLGSPQRCTVRSEGEKGEIALHIGVRPR